MLSDHPVLAVERFMGGLAASMYFFAVSPMYAQFPCNPSNRQPPALRLLDSVPPCRLKWSGLPVLHGRCLADSNGAVVVSIAGVHLSVECRQSRRPAPAQTVETAMCGWPV